jgi:hypothetical protein
MRKAIDQLVTDAEGAGDEVCVCADNHDVAIGSPLAASYRYRKQ